MKETNGSTTYYHLQNCPADKICHLVANSMGICILRQRLRVGELVEKSAESTNPECYSNNCTNGLCISIPDSKPCTSHYACSSQLYCTTLNLCAPLKKEGEKCLSDSDCIAGYLCGRNYTWGDKACMKELSIPKGSYASQRMLFTTGMLYDKGYGYDTFGSSGGTCAESTLIGFNKDCLEDNDCLYTLEGVPGNLFTGKCVCSLNGVDGRCQINTVDDKRKDWLVLYSSTISGITIGENESTNYLRDTIG